MPSESDQDFLERMTTAAQYEKRAGFQWTRVAISDVERLIGALRAEQSGARGPLCGTHRQRLSESRVCPICEWAEHVHSEALQQARERIAELEGRAAEADKSLAAIRVAADNAERSYMAERDTANNLFGRLMKLEQEQAVDSKRLDGLQLLGSTGVDLVAKDMEAETLREAIDKVLEP